MIGIKRSLTRELPYSVNRPLTRVELHVHTLGAARHETIWDLSKQKNLELPGRGTLRELKDYLVVKKGVSLDDFISRFDIIVQSFKGDLKAIERLAYEIVEDAASQGIVYFEARFCPHMFFPPNVPIDQSREWVWKVAATIIKGLERGQNDFSSKGNLIATCIRNNPPHWYAEAIELVADKNFHGGQIIGVDIAAVADFAGILDSATDKQTQTNRAFVRGVGLILDFKVTVGDGIPNKKSLESEPSVTFCQDAAKLGIPRTIHAGESGSAESVRFALDTLLANRIGHGYRIIDDPVIFERVKKERVHLETCPWSSILTGSVSPTEYPHPIVRFFENDFNASINTDDPTVTGTLLDDEFRLLHSWGLSEVHFAKASFNAARSAFLPENEKADLVQSLSKNFGCTL